MLITGASSGIGALTALKLIDKGYIVYAAARRVDKMRALEAAGAHILEMDVTVDDQMIAGIERLISEQGRIDILINNAGYGSFGAVEDVPIDEARRQFEVNLFGMARLIQLVLPYMRRNRSGKIINISSIAAKIYQPLGAWYHSTKFAVEGLSDCLRLELKPFGIKVVMIEPGPIKSDWDKIAVEHMMETSGETAYALIANKMSKYFKMGYSGPISGPMAVTSKIIKAIEKSSPRSRYIAGRGSGLLLFFRKILSDRMFDRIISRIMIPK